MGNARVLTHLPFRPGKPAGDGGYGENRRSSGRAKRDPFCAFLRLLFFLCLPVVSVQAAQYRAKPGVPLEIQINALKAGDEFVIPAGVHEESIEIGGLQGSTNSPIVIRGEPGAIIRPDGRDGILLTKCRFITLDGLQIEKAKRAGIVMQGSRDVTVRDCVVAGCGRWGIQTAMCDAISVENCDISGSREEHGIYFSTTDNPRVLGCRIYDNGGCGIHLNGDKNEGGDGMISGGVIKDNEISRNGSRGGAAINMDGVEGTAVWGNRMTANRAGGISVFHEDGARTGGGNNIQYNVIEFDSGMGRYGIQVLGKSPETVVERNDVCGGGGPGIHADENAVIDMQCDRNTIRVFGNRIPFQLGNRAMTLVAWRYRTGLDQHTRVKRIR